MVVTLVEDAFEGLYTYRTTAKSTSVRLFTWRNSNNVSVQVISYGATVTSIKVPDKNGSVQEIVMGFNNLKGYEQSNNPYFGSTVGRVANRIGFGKIKFGNSIINVNKNLNNKHQLHGGFIGFDKVLWEPYVNGTKLILSYHSTDGEEGYPGDLVVQTVFELTDDNEFLVDFLASTTKPTFVNLTNHSYFNLAGHDAGAEALYKHVITINADQITEVDGDSIPTGNLTSVANTAFDLRVPKVLREAIPKTPGSNGFDHNFCITKGPEQGNTFVARAVHPDSGRVLEIYSDQPGVQFYTGNGLPEKSSAISGKGKYFKHGAFCLETQKYPDAPNHSNFPSILLNPGEIYKHHVSYKFSLQN